VKQVGRPSQKGVEPNDRHYDPDLAKAIRRMRDEEFDALLRHGDDDTSN
jgi:hypothetical protein